MARTPKSKPADAVAAFVVAAGRTLEHDGTVYEEGDELELGEAEAQPLRAIGVLLPAVGSTDEQTPKE